MYEFLDYRVRDVMSRPAVSVEPQTPLREVERLLEKHGFNALPVVDAEGQVLGLVSSLDLLKAFRFTEDRMLPPYEEILQRPVIGVMTPAPVAVRPDAPLSRVLERMVESRTKSFPVVEDGRLVGMVAREDVMQALRRADAGEGPAGRAGRDPDPGATAV